LFLTRLGEGQACAFCGKDVSAVVHLVVGPMVSICAECLGVAEEIVAERQAERPARSARR